MSPEVASRLEQFFEQRTDGELRSIVTYDHDSVDVVYIRDDVAAQYTDTEVRNAVDSARIESLYAPIYERTFSKDHGDLECLVNCFEHVVEMNFALAAGVGAAVALDAEAMDEAHGLVSAARNVALEDRE